MLNFKDVASKAIARLAEGLAQDLERVKELAEQAEKWRRVTGKTLELNEWNMNHYLYEIITTVEELPTIRKVMGQLEVTGKVPSYGGEPGEIDVMLRPKSKEWNRIKIRYSKVLNGTEKCKIVTSTYDQKTLVCEVK